jgi:hypothetical protein
MQQIHLRFQQKRSQLLSQGDALFTSEPSNLDSRLLVLKDVTAVGILSASPGLTGAIDFYSRGEINPKPIVAATVALHQSALVLSGKRPEGAGIGPKFHIDPQAM